LVNQFLIAVAVLAYIAFGGVSFYISVITPKNQLVNSNTGFKIMYWHGICFAAAFITLVWLGLLAYCLFVIQ